jgi:plasmid maintenance system killer protein
MAVEFRDAWLEAFYEEDKGHKKIPSIIEAALQKASDPGCGSSGSRLENSAR